jgi:hypothetical protein
VKDAEFWGLTTQIPKEPELTIYRNRNYNGTVKLLYDVAYIRKQQQEKKEKNDNIH